MSSNQLVVTTRGHCEVLSFISTAEDHSELFKTYYNLFSVYKQVQAQTVYEFVVQVRNFINFLEGRLFNKKLDRFTNKNNIKFVKRSSFFNSFLDNLLMKLSPALRGALQIRDARSGITSLPQHDGSNAASGKCFL